MIRKMKSSVLTTHKGISSGSLKKECDKPVRSFWSKVCIAGIGEQPGLSFIKQSLVGI